MTPSFVETLRYAPFIVTEGAVVERLRRDPRGDRLHPVVANAALLYDPEGRRLMEGIYRGYLDAACAMGVPLLLLTPTWRANPERLASAGLAGWPVQADAFRFLDGLKPTAGGAPVYIGGLMGCRGDAYNPREALAEGEAEDFHFPQARALAAAGVDLLYGATLPALSEAVGMARAVARTACPYILGFPLRAGGTLLDGTPLSEAVARLDASGGPRALGYMGHCVHPSVFAEAMEVAYRTRAGTAGRWIGLQANASALTPEELEGAGGLLGDGPEPLAEAIASVKGRWGLRLVGGCCGTDARLVAALGARLAANAV